MGSGDFLSGFVSSFQPAYHASGQNFMAQQEQIRREKAAAAAQQEQRSYEAQQLQGAREYETQQLQGARQYEQQQVAGQRQFQTAGVQDERAYKEQQAAEAEAAERQQALLDLGMEEEQRAKLFAQASAQSPELAGVVDAAPDPEAAFDLLAEHNKPVEEMSAYEQAQIGMKERDMVASQAAQQATLAHEEKARMDRLELDRQKLELEKQKAGRVDLPEGYEAAPEGGLRPIAGGPADKPAEGSEPAKPPSGYKWGPDGQSLVAIPGGPADVTPTQGKVKELTEGQRKALALGTRAKGALDTAQEVMEKGYDPTSWMGAAQDLTSVTQSQESKQFDQAFTDAANAINRLESGAQITPMDSDAFNAAYKPALNDGPEVIAQKKNSLQKYVNHLVELNSKEGGSKPGEYLGEGETTPADEPSWAAGVSNEDIIRMHQEAAE
jgi:hypothetical protein